MRNGLKFPTESSFNPKATCLGRNGMQGKVGMMDGMQGKFWEIFLVLMKKSSSSLIVDMFRPSGTPQYNPKFPKKFH